MEGTSFPCISLPFVLGREEEFGKKVTFSYRMLGKLERRHCFEDVQSTKDQVQSRLKLAKSCHLV